MPAILTDSRDCAAMSVPSLAGFTQPEAMETDMEIRHEPDQNRFTVSVDNQEGVLEYRLEDGTVDFNRTFVPEDLRGRGLARHLVNRGFTWAEEKGLKIEASCSYAAKQLANRHAR